MRFAAGRRCHREETCWQKRTKTSILCSKCPKMGVSEGKSAQKPRFCARNARKWGFRRAKAHKNADFVLGRSAESGTLPRGIWCWVASARNLTLGGLREAPGAGAVLPKWRRRGVSGRYSWALISRDAPSGVMMVCPASGAQRWPMMS